jgi:hypothetical protein
VRTLGTLRACERCQPRYGRGMPIIPRLARRDAFDQQRCPRPAPASTGQPSVVRSTRESLVRTACRAPRAVSVLVHRVLVPPAAGARNNVRRRASVSPAKRRPSAGETRTRGS